MENNEISVQSEQKKGNKPGNKRLPPWMSVPDAPPRPNFQNYSKQLKDLNAEKDKLLEEIKNLQQSVKSNGESDESRSERDTLRAKISEIDAERKNERTLRIAKNEELTSLRKKRRENGDKIRALQADLGGFTSAKELEEAIEYMKRKMEYTGGGLEVEKKNNRRLHQLEQAKGLFLQLQPLTEAMQKAEEREMMLEQEYREIHERIGILNKQYDEALAQKKKLDSKAMENSSGRTEVYRKCDELRVQLNKVFDAMKKIKEERQERTESWDAWCISAKANYVAQLEAIEEERIGQAAQAKNAVKLANKRARAEKRQNPFAAEILLCNSLVEYLKEKRQTVAREEEQRAKAIAAESFDPHAAAPEGCVVIFEGKGSKSTIGKRNKKIIVQHSREKFSQFKSVGVEPPSEPSAIGVCLEEVQKKKAEYESHIKAGELVLSSGDESEEPSDS